MPRGDFRLTATKFHVTWKGFIPFEDLHALAAKYGKLVAYSHVHETGSLREEGDDVEGYEHTHAAWLFAAAGDCSNVKVWDHGDAHPHIKNRRSMPWMQYLFETYHKGHKVAKDGKKFYKAPEAIEQSDVSTWNPKRIAIEQVVKTSDVLEAFEIADVGIKSIGDVLAVRRECATKRKHEHEWDEDATGEFVDKPWDRKKALVMIGDSQCGKTAWACKQFENPVLVCELNELKNFNYDGVDGIVFDEADFAKFKRKTQIFMNDLKYTRTIKVADYTITLPKGMPRIFCNNQSCFLDLPEIRNRHEVWDTRGAGDSVPVYFKK
jgi:hypothetical protein